MRTFQLTPPAKPHSPSPAFWALSGVLVCSVLLPLPGPDSRIAHIAPLCPFYALTGLPCPGCGLTRAFVCLGHGQIAQSLHWHPLGIVVYAACLAVWGGLGWEAAHGGTPAPWLHRRNTAQWATAGLVLLLTAGLLRIGTLLATHAHWPS